MGRFSAFSMHEQVHLKQIKLEQAIGWHLQSNHYPQIPLSMVQPCIRAIKNAEHGEWDKNVRLPKGITYLGKRLAPTHAMVEMHHLDSFIDDLE